MPARQSPSTTTFPLHRVVGRRKLLASERRACWASHAPLKRRSRRFPSTVSPKHAHTLTQSQQLGKTPAHTLKFFSIPVGSRSRHQRVEACVSLKPRAGAGETSTCPPAALPPPPLLAPPCASAPLQAHASPVMLGLAHRQRLHKGQHESLGERSLTGAGGGGLLDISFVARGACLALEPAARQHWRQTDRSRMEPPTYARMATCVLKGVRASCRRSPSPRTVFRDSRDCGVLSARRAKSCTGGRAHRASRSSRSSRTRMLRPSSSVLVRELMASVASSAVSNSTMPHLRRPRDNVTPRPSPTGTPTAQRGQIQVDEFTSIHSTGAQDLLFFGGGGSGLPFGAAGVGVGHDVCVHHGAHLTEVVLERLPGGLPRQVHHVAAPPGRATAALQSTSMPPRRARHSGREGRQTNQDGMGRGGRGRPSHKQAAKQATAYTTLGAGGGRPLACTSARTYDKHHTTAARVVRATC